MSRRTHAGPTVASVGPLARDGRQIWLFPLDGVVTEDDGAGFDDPIFPDAAIVARARLARVAEAHSDPVEQDRTRCLLGLSPMSLFPRPDTTDMMSLSDAQAGEFHSFLAVRAGGKDAVHYAEERAVVLGSLLAFCFLATSPVPKTFSLWSRLALPVVDRQIGFTASGELIGVRWNRAPNTCDSLLRPPVLLNRDDWMTLLAVKDLQPLIRIVEGRATNSARETLTSAVVAAVAAATSVTQSTRVLYSINAVECLLLRDERWSKLAPRARALLGQKAEFELNPAELAQARHDVVHKNLIPSPEVSARCLAFAVASVLAAADLLATSGLKSMHELRLQLDKGADPPDYPSPPWLKPRR